MPWYVLNGHKHCISRSVCIDFQKAIRNLPLKVWKGGRPWTFRQKVAKVHRLPNRMQQSGPFLYFVWPNEVSFPGRLRSRNLGFCQCIRFACLETALLSIFTVDATYLQTRKSFRCFLFYLFHLIEMMYMGVVKIYSKMSYRVGPS